MDDSLRESNYQALVTEMQGNKTTQKVASQEGARNGLRLTLDLHSNTVSLGTLDQQHNAFKMFIGEPAQFPMMKDKSIPLEAGHEHFVDLSAKVVSTNGIRDILPEARGCFFSDEGDLEFYKSYTFSNCRLECMIIGAEEKLNCIPPLLATHADQMCDVRFNLTKDESKEIFELFWNKYLNFEPSSCKKPCTHTAYEVQLKQVIETNLRALIKSTFSHKY